MVLNITVTEPQAAGFVTVYPCNLNPPLASNVNYAAGQTIANTVIIKVTTAGAICIFNSQTAHIIIDVTGYYTN